MNIRKDRAARITTCLVTVVLTACGSGGGGGSAGEENNGPIVELPPDPSDLTIATSKTTFIPLETIELAVSSTVAPGPKGYLVQMDLTGTGGFDGSATIEVPGLNDLQTVSVSAPFISFLEGTSIAYSDTVWIRLRRQSDGELSNEIAVAIEAVELDPGDAGVPSTLLEIMLQEMLLNDPLLVAQAGRLQPGRLIETVDALNLDLSILDRQAAAILIALFGIDTSVSTDNTGALKPRRRFYDLKSPVVLEGFESSIACIGDLLEAFETLPASAADECFNQVRRGVREQLIPSISRLQTTASNIAANLTALFGLSSRTLLGGYAQRMAQNAAMARYADKLAQFALRQPALGGSIDETVAYSIDQLTDVGKARVYSYITRELDAASNLVLAEVGAPDAVGNAIDYSARELAALADLESELLSLPSVVERLKSLPQRYGIDGLSNDAPRSVSIPGVGSLDIEKASDPATICLEHPEIESGALLLGFDSCQSFIEPFLDPVFMFAIMPIIDGYESILGELEQAGCLVDTSAPGCEALYSQLPQLSSDLLSSLTQYGAQEFMCDGSYQQFDSGFFATCVWSSLAYTPPGGNCFAGSHRPSFDVGSASICVYFSRDHFLLDGTCRENYVEVFFLGTERCRWFDLPLSRPAVYSLERGTGDRAVIVR